MLVPGANLLNLALRVINPQPVIWRAWQSHNVNANGTYENVYAADKAILGSLQGVDRKLYQQLGLDMSKNYATLYTTELIQVVKRDGSGDLIVYNAKLFKAEAELDWQGPDGWGAYTCIQVDIQ